MESAELTKENRKHWSPMMCAIYYLNIQQNTWGLTTWGSVETWRGGISAQIPFSGVFRSFVSSLDFGFKPSKACLQHALVGQVLQPRALLGTSFFFFVAVVSTHVFVLQKSVQLFDPREPSSPKPWKEPHIVWGMFSFGKRKEHFRFSQTRIRI